jgi:MoaA/NifB/PqqE/SkfB family radical SAM enzyme
MNWRVEREIVRRKDMESRRAARLAAWGKGERPGPFKVMYYPTNICNLECAICWQRLGVEDYSELSLDRRRDLVAEANQLRVQEFVIGGGGEPLARWSQIRPMFDAIKASGMYGLLFTNGTLLSRDIAEHLVGIGWNKVLVSIDGQREANDEVRETGSYDRILSGLDRLLQARGDSELPLVGAGCVLTRQGVRDLPDLVRMLGERGCDQLNLIRLVVYLDSQRRFVLPEDDMSRLNSVLEDAMTEAERTGMATNLAQYLDRQLVQSAERFETVLLSDRTLGSTEDRFRNALCFEPFSNMVIHPNGMVGPCCMSGDRPVASVVERTLSDVWYGDEFTRLRNGILKREPEPYCRICDLNVFQENQRLRLALVGTS